jgi:hypothetical protein
MSTNIEMSAEAKKAVAASLERVLQDTLWL